MTQEKVQDNSLKLDFKVVKGISFEDFKFAKDVIEQLNNVFPEQWRDEFSGEQHSSTINFEAENGIVTIIKTEDGKTTKLPITFKEPKNYAINPLKNNDLLLPLSAVFEIMGRTETCQVSFPYSFNAHLLTDQSLLKGRDLLLNGEWTTTDSELDDDYSEEEDDYDHD